MRSGYLCILAVSACMAGNASTCMAQSAAGSPVSTPAAPPDAPVSADNENSLTSVNSFAPFVVTVTASRSADQMQYEPQSQNVISAEMLERRQPSTLNSMLREQAGIFGNIVANQGSPIIRGQIGNRVLYLWNGLRINNSANFSGPNGYFNEMPLGAVDRIEVVRGPGAVEYGSDAVGGVVNFITRHSDEFGSPRHFGGDVDDQYGTVNTDTLGYGDLWGSFARFNFTTGGTGQSLGNYSAPSIGLIKDTGLSDEGGYFDALFKVRAKQTFHLGWIESVRNDVVSYSQSKLNPSGIPRSNTPYEERGIGRADYDITGSGKWSNDFHLYSYFEHFRSPRNTDVESATAFNLTHSVSSQAVFGGGAQNTVALRKNDALTYGVDYRSEDLWSEKLLFTTTKGTGAMAISVPNGNVPPGTYGVFDAFILSRLQLRQRLTVSLGGRIESIHLKSDPRPQDALSPFTVADLTLDERWNPLTGSVGAVYKATNSFSLTADIASSFRSPSFSDALSTGVPVYASSVATVPSPGVKPEKGIEYEAGGRWASHHINLNLDGYWTALSDVIVAQPTGTINIPGVGLVIAQSNTNSDTGYVRGIEMAGAIHFNSQWNLIGNLTTTRGQDTFQNVPLRFIPPTNGLFGVAWDSPHQKYWAEATAYMVDRLHRHAPNDEADAGFSQDPGYGSPSATNPPYRPGFEIPGYALANLRFGARMFTRERRGVDLILDLNNVLNQPYREVYSQQELLAPGFGAVIGGRWSF
jgi:outer membrane receptor protein involved in Fe transport